MPDILISSGGAFVKKGSEYICIAEFSENEKNMIETARVVCRKDCKIIIDIVDAHYWNYKIDSKKLGQSWGDSTYTDFVNFSECAFKMRVEIFNDEKELETN